MDNNVILSVKGVFSAVKKLTPEEEQENKTKQLIGKEEEMLSPKIVDDFGTILFHLEDVVMVNEAENPNHSLVSLHSGIIFICDVKASTFRETFRKYNYIVDELQG